MSMFNSGCLGTALSPFVQGASMAAITKARTREQKDVIKYFLQRYNQYKR